jgi:hypothetical protein
MARSERQDEDARAGVSTITRPGVRQRPPNVQAAPNVQSVPNVKTAPNVKPAPNVQAAPTARQALRPAAASPARSPARSTVGTHRLPFVLLLCGLLGGALISALVITTTLAEGAFEITKLQNATTGQAKQLLTLQEQVAQAQSAQQIETRAAKLGMVGVSELRYFDLKTGKISTDADPGWEAPIPAGYTP